MIRTNTVQLTVIPAIAYRHKLTSGGSGITILRYGIQQPGIASISKTSGEPMPAVNTRLDQYPLEAFKEAIELTAGMPYGKRKPVKVTAEIKPAELDETEPEAEATPVDTAEYQKVVEKYTDKNGKLSYDLLNKDLIKAGSNSRMVADMLAADASVDDIRLTIVRNQFAAVTGNPDIKDEQVLGMLEMLDEVSPKGVCKELNEEIRRWKRNAKK